ncbi:MAG: hypothetical protein RLZZ573_554, partial [Pseudomonadota bacterium]
VSYNNSDWARTSFQNWLCKGNGITVFSHAFYNPKSPNQSPKIYYIHFWLNGDTLGNSQFSRIGKAFSNADGFERLDFSPSMFHVNTQNTGKPAYEKSLGSGIEHVSHWEDLQDRFAYYQVDRAAMIDALEVEEYQKDKIILENLFFSNDASGTTIPQISLKAFDVTQAYQASIDAAEEEGGAAVKSKSQLADYPEDWEVMDVFESNMRLVSGEYELLITLPEPKSLPFGRHLFRLDLVLQESRQQWNSEWDDQLTWLYDTGKNCSKVKSLSTSTPAPK